MKRYFTHIDPILTGSKVTFLTPDNAPSIKSNKKIECRNYSYLSKSVTRGTVLGVSANRQQLKVQYYKPGVDKPVTIKVPMTHAHNSANVFVNKDLLMSAMQHKKHLGVGVPPIETPSVQNHVISIQVRQENKTMTSLTPLHHHPAPPPPLTPLLNHRSWIILSNGFFLHNRPAH